MKKTILRLFLLMVVILFGHNAQAQDKKVTGRVYSKTDGLPLPGVSVVVKNNKKGTTTDFDGKFTISIGEENEILVFSFVGYKKVEQKVTVGTKISVSMEESAEQLNEIKVTTGYEKTAKRTFTGATSKISEKNLKIEGVVDVSRMIEGKATGVTVQNVTGSFGAAPKITVRGSSSIFGDTKPLWVIDGVVQEDIINFSLADLTSGNSETLLSSGVAGINANDILSIDLLKDAAATSIYGSRALNGVVVITTKQGKRDTPLNIVYSVENTMRTVPNYGQYDILNSQQSMSIFKELESKGFLQLTSTTYGRYGGVYNIMAREINRYDSQTGFGLKNDEPSRNAFLRKYEMANTDWFAELFRPNITQNHSLSFSGGGKNSTYYASLGYYNDPGWTLADNVKRLTSNIKSTFFVNDRLNVTISTLASIRDQRAPGSYESKKDVYFGATTRDFDINPFNYVLNTSRTLRPRDEQGNLEYYRNNWAPLNILNELDNNYMDLSVKDIRFQADLDYKITPEITYNMTSSVRYVNTTREHNILEGSNVIAAHQTSGNTQIDNANIFLYQDPNNLTAPKIGVLPNGGIRRTFANDLVSFNFRNTLNYKKTFKEKHELEGFVGQEIRSVDRNSNNFSAFGLQYGKGLTSNTDPKMLEKLILDGNSYFGFNEERERTVGFFGKANYTFDRKYTLSLTGRYDGSNRQGNSNASRWLPTYTVSGKWNLTEESFMKKAEFISNLALRASYGLTATAGPATNSLAIFRSFITNRLRLGNRESGLLIDELQNGDLTWEKQFETNIGLDLSLFNNRLQLTTDVYKRNAFDLVDYVTTTGIGGQRIKQGNNADMVTKGIELGITGQIVKTDKFKWTSNLNLSVYNQEITKLQSQPSVLGLVEGSGGNAIGHPRNSLYSFQFTGLNSDGLPTFKFPEGVTDNVGGANFQDNDNITSYLKYEGTIEPNKTVGFSNTFEYENWSFNFLIVASGGNKIRLNPLFSSTYNDLTVFTKDFTNRWINPGDEFRTNIPVIASNDLIRNYGSSQLQFAYNAYNYSDARIADGGFVRLKSISLGYELPKDLKKKLGLSTFNLKFVSSNPWLIYSDKKLNGQDPEFFRSGGVAMPITSQYSLVLNLSL